MKKIIFSIFMISILLITQSVTVFGFSVSPHTSRQIDSVKTEYLGDNLYCITVIESLPNNDENVFPETETSSTLATTITKSKTDYIKNSSGKTLWYVRVTGTFTYGNGSSKCISATPSADSLNSLWEVSNLSSSKSGNQARAQATGKHYVDGVVTDQLTRSVTLTCSSTGVFS